MSKREAEGWGAERETGQAVVELYTGAVRCLRSYLRCQAEGLYRQGWDRLRAAGVDVDLREKATEANARALLWIAENLVPVLPTAEDPDVVIVGE